MGNSKVRVMFVLIVSFWKGGIIFAHAVEAETAKDLQSFLSSAELVEASAPDAWRKPDRQNLMLLELDNGEVLFELSPEFAPEHVKNIRKMIGDKYFDGLAVIRSQDNYVAQWGDPNAGQEGAKDLGDIEYKLAPEFFRDLEQINFNAVESRDAYAQQVGFVGGFPVSSNGKQAWLTHCYGMLGVARGEDADSGNGSGLYMVTGHAPRHLDRNVTLVGRALSGTGVLSSLPRGTGPLGFYESDTEYARIKSVRLGTDLPEGKTDIEIMRTDTETFKRFVELRTTRNEEWFLHPTGKIELCNISVPTRLATN